MTNTLIPATAVREGTFTLDGKLLSDTVQLVGKAAGTTAASAIIVLTFRDQRLTLTATDFDTTVSIKIPVKGKRGATVGVLASELRTVTKALANEEAVTIVTGGEDVVVQAGETVYHLPALTEFPKMVLPEPVVPTQLDLEAFVRVTRIAGAAAGTDEARPILTGIYFHEVGDKPVAAATDSFRLAVVRNAPAGLQALIPAAACKVACQVFDADDEVAFDKVSDSKIVFTSATKSVTARLIDGEYPAYQNLIRPAKQDTFKVAAPREQLVAALDKVRVVAGSFPVKITVEDANMHLSVVNEARSAADDVELTTGHTDVPTIGMNPQYLAQLLKSVPGSDVITLGFVDPFKPVNLSDGDDPSWHLLLMPVK